MKRILKKIGNWSNYPVIECTERSFSLEKEAKSIIQKEDSLIVRGAGRCYGDSSLASSILNSTKFNHILEFDSEKGVLFCEAGVSLEKVIDLILPYGWFLPITPGTKFITVGGAVASNVHGKNHHKEGCFCDHVMSIDLMNDEGETKSITKDQDPELFDLTAGGMGLTGAILKVKFQLKKVDSSFISQKSVAAKNLDEIFDLFENHQDTTYTMAWIDCFQKGKDLGRSIFYAGEHASLDELPENKRSKPLELAKKGKLTIPFSLPGFILNKWSIKLFNWAYYFKNKWTQGKGLLSYDPFFYPLDGILHWNRMYGKAGFVQYQFVIPLQQSKEGLKEILTKINEKGMGSFLAVLKLFGPQHGVFAFPMEGYTLALDFPIRKGLFEFLDELDELVHKHGGRLYLTKDARMKKDIFEKGYTNAAEIRKLILKYNHQGKFQSLQSQRLNLTQPLKSIIN
jgi:decaprenylphospho-beta-D-ribofuranose 2-oxidase